MRGSPTLSTLLTTILTGLLTAGLLGTALLATTSSAPARTVGRGPEPPPPSAAAGGPFITDGDLRLRRPSPGSRARGARPSGVPAASQRPVEPGTERRVAEPPGCAPVRE